MDAQDDQSKSFRDYIGENKLLLGKSKDYYSEINTVLGMVGSLAAAGVCMRYKKDKADINTIMDATIVGALSVARIA